jgi:putative sugar O-methyltransferase
MTPLGYALTTYYVVALDSRRILDRLDEDDKFGNFTFQIAGRTVSRDLLDSINELYFLNKHLDIERKNARILDIGAGYGRLACRTVTAFPGVRYLCTDAVAVSTFVSDFYLRFRGVQDRAVAVPLDQIEQTLEIEPVDLAVNIHSFSECSAEAIGWWLRLLSRNRVNYLMIVPNGDTPNLLTNDKNDFQPIVEQHGYRLICREPKYQDPIVQQYGINPSYYFLFALR